MSTIERFYAKTSWADDGSGCLVWTACRLPKGYGRFGGTLAHRWIYAAIHGVRLGRWDFVLHACDNPPCVNILHLRLGTAKENTADMIRKGRRADVSVRGERNSKSKLTAAQVVAIRTRFAGGGVSKNSLAREYGVSAMAVHYIVIRRNWAHVA